MPTTLKDRPVVKLIHCGNRNILDPTDRTERHIFYIPMGLFSLADQLNRGGAAVEIIHLDLEGNKDIPEILGGEAVDAVGLDLHWAKQCVAVTDCAQRLKRLNPGIFVFIGGYTASFFAQEILRDHPAIDAVIRGDGEIPIVELGKALQSRKADRGSLRDHERFLLESVPNLVWRAEDGKIVFNEFSYVSTATEMSEFDFARLDLLRNGQSYLGLSKYWTKFPWFRRHPIFFLEVGRGCPYNCLCCGGSAGAQKCLNNRSRQAVRSVDSVISSIKKAISFGYTSFLTCFEFEGSDGWYSGLARRIEEEKLKIGLVYECWSLPSKSLIDTLSRCCEQVIITISPDTADEHLRRVNRDARLFYTNRELEERLSYIGSQGNVKAQLFFGYFLPHDTADTVFHTVDYVLKLFAKFSHFCEFVYMNFDTDPCSLLFMNPAAYECAVAVRTFGDYVEKIRAHYRKNDHNTGTVLLSKPSALTDLEAVDLANKISLFNRLLLFEESIPLIFKKAANIDMYTDYFKDIDLSFAVERDISIKRARNMLRRICKHRIPADQEVLDLIETEYKSISAVPYVENLTNLYTAVPEAGGQNPDRGSDSIYTEFDIG